MSKNEWNSRPASKLDVCVVSDYGSWKRDALLFDKIYISKYEEEHRRPPAELTFNIEDHDDQENIEREGFQRHIVPAAGYVDPNTLLEGVFGTSDHKLIDANRKRNLANECADKGLNATPSYETQVLFYHDFPDGTKTAYDGAINNLPIIDEHRVSWNQILDFRSDPEAARKYRALRRFLHHSLQAKSVQEATDIIETMIEDYGWAIRKHGMETRIGAISQVLDWKRTSLMAGSATALGAVGGPVLAALSTGILTTASAVVYLMQRKIDLEEIRRGPNAEIAILYEARDRFDS